MAVSGGNPGRHQLLSMANAPGVDRTEHPTGRPRQWRLFDLRLTLLLGSAEAIRSAQCRGDGFVTRRFEQR